MNEEIIGVTGGASLGSGFRSKIYYLLFTSSRVIVAKGGSGFMQSLGFFSGSPGLILGSALKDKKKSEELSKLSPGEVLASDKDNFEIPYSDVTKVEVKKPGFFSPAGSIIIHTPAKKHRFNETAPGEIFDRYIELIKTVLPGKYAGK